MSVELALRQVEIALLRTISTGQTMRSTSTKGKCGIFPFDRKKYERYILHKLTFIRVGSAHTKSNLTLKGQLQVTSMVAVLSLSQLRT